jgi:hypothetical protein
MYVHFCTLSRRRIGLLRTGDLLIKKDLTRIRDVYSKANESHPLESCLYIFYILCLAIARVSNCGATAPKRTSRAGKLLKYPLGFLFATSQARESSGMSQ